MRRHPPEKSALAELRGVAHKISVPLKLFAGLGRFFSKGRRRGAGSRPLTHLTKRKGEIFVYEENTKKPIPWGKIIRALILLALVFLLFGRMIVYWIDRTLPPQTSLLLYLKFSSFDGWLTEEDPYLIFPQADTVKRADSSSYLHKKLTSPTILYDNDVLTYLCCVYHEDLFAAETERLASICDGPAEGWALPAYVLETNFPNGFSSYALVDTEQRTIYYFSVQGTMLLEQYIPSELYHERQSQHISK